MATHERATHNHIVSRVCTGVYVAAVAALAADRVSVFVCLYYFIIFMGFFFFSSFRFASIGVCVESSTATMGDCDHDEPACVSVCLNNFVILNICGVRWMCVSLHHIVLYGKSGMDMRRAPCENVVHVCWALRWRQRLRSERSMN